jgi:hypothetical protein
MTTNSPSPFGTTATYAGSTAAARDRARRRVQLATGSVGALALVGAGVLTVQLAPGPATGTATLAAQAVTTAPTPPTTSSNTGATTQSTNAAPVTSSGGS